MSTLLAGIALGVAAGCGGGAGPAAQSSPAPTVPPGAVQVHLTTAFRITPAAITVTAGSVTFWVVNDGNTGHDFVIQDSTGKRVDGTRLLASGESTTLTVTLAQGTYTTMCDVAGHAAAGMVGTITAT
ncbi:MAG: plastocyanin/azurin family copper-binding protein [Candidatus Dormibacteria bacterium]